MRIALFHNLPAGGAKRALWEHTRCLVARGHTVDGYVMSSADEEYLPLKSLCRKVYTYEAPDIAKHMGPTRRILLYHPRLRQIWNSLGEAFYRTAIERAQFPLRRKVLDLLDCIYTDMAAQIDTRDYDIVYVHQCQLLLSPSLLCALKTPTVYYNQDTLRNIYEWPVETQMSFRYDARNLHWSYAQKDSNPYWRWWEEERKRNLANIRASDLVLANSYYSREAILRAYGIDARVCYLGIDSDFFCPDMEITREKVVLSVGGLSPAKRHDFVLDAIATIPPGRRPRMHVIGYDPARRFGDTRIGLYGEALLKRAQECGVELTISKDVSDEALRAGYRRATVLAFAPYLEPFGLVALEAMACGTPVVGVREAGLRESIQDGVTGLLTDRDVEAFGAALERLLFDPTLAHEMGMRGRRSIQCDWTWERSADILEEHLGRLTGGQVKQSL